MIRLVSDTWPLLLLDTCCIYLLSFKVIFSCYFMLDCFLYLLIFASSQTTLLCSTYTCNAIYPDGV